MTSSSSIGKGHCESCGSSDGNEIYDDGHSYCFVCETHAWVTEEYLQKTGLSLNTLSPRRNYKNETKSTTIPDLPELPTDFTDLKDRGISADTAKFYGVTNNLGDSHVKHIYPYYDSHGTYVAAKARTHTKKFMWRGDKKSAALFGQHLFPPNSAKQITITEGECDAMAAYQMQGSKYPVVSVHAAADARKLCAENFHYLDSFEQIVLCFDADEPKFNPMTGQTHYPGQEAAQLVARLFPIGKVRIVTFAKHKDANDYLLEGDGREFMQEWWSAPLFTPTGLVVSKDLWDKVKVPKTEAEVSFPWTILQKLTYGIRKSEVIMLTAETGRGKTTVVKELEHHVLNTTPDDVGVGIIHLEEPNDDTALGLMSITANKPLHLPDVRKEIEEEELRKYFDETLNNDRVIMFDHFGSNSIDIILSTIRYMNNMGCEYVFLDHISILVSDQNGDERKKLDEACTKIKTLCMELNIALIGVVHQNRQGEIRGSAAIEQLSNTVIKMTRDVKAKDPFIRNVTTLEVEKNRFCGRTGPAGYLFYDGETGRLRELDEHEAARYEGGVAPEEFIFEKREENWEDG